MISFTHERKSWTCSELTLVLRQLWVHAMRR
jgi:hypothetical protein